MTRNYLKKLEILKLDFELVEQRRRRFTEEEKVHIFCLWQKNKAFTCEQLRTIVEEHLNITIAISTVRRIVLSRGGTFSY